jgi:DNA-binding transcriptional LysR family regulator
MKPLRINISQLITFLFVAKYKSYREASEQLFITQPAVSMQIRSFERQFGMKLFLRKDRELVLTEAGKKILPLAEEIYNSALSCERFLSDINRICGGELRLGVSRTLNLFIARHISVFKEKFPSVKIILKEGSTKTILTGLEKYAYDVAVLSPYPHSQKISTIQLSREEMIFVGSPSHPFINRKKVTLSELSGTNFILPGEGSGTRMKILKLFENEGIKPKFVAEIDNPETIKKLVMGNKGISLMFPPLIKNELEEGKIAKIPVDKEIYIPVEVAYVKKSLISPVIKAFLDVLETHIPHKA